MDPEAIEQRYGRRHWRTPQSLGSSGCQTGKVRDAAHRWARWRMYNCLKSSMKRAIQGFGMQSSRVPHGSAARLNMPKRGNRAARQVVLLATCFFLFTLAQTARPVEYLAFLSHPGIAAKYQKLTRHTLEEVSSRVAGIDSSAGNQTTVQT
jgi:hypothetical protein